jgi:hypothetical protein
MNLALSILLRMRPEDEEHINFIEQEASSLFPHGKFYASPNPLITCFLEEGE